MKILAGLLLISCLPGFAQEAPGEQPDMWKSLRFLQGTWEADTQGKQGVTSAGTYAFQLELKDHIMARRITEKSDCKGPAGFDCDHGDVLYVYQDAPGQLKAIYFDNEGHVIHYDVSTPGADTVVFLSEASRPGPRFRLTYQLKNAELKNAVMAGKFQTQMPGQAEWKSYLEWSGGKK